LSGSQRSCFSAGVGAALIQVKDFADGGAEYLHGPEARDGVRHKDFMGCLC
jgi:hypothetical protein